MTYPKITPTADDAHAALLTARRQVGGHGLTAIAVEIAKAHNGHMPGPSNAEVQEAVSFSRLRTVLGELVSQRRATLIHVHNNTWRWEAAEHTQEAEDASERNRQAYRQRRAEEQALQALRERHPKEFADLVDAYLTKEQ